MEIVERAFEALKRGLTGHMEVLVPVRSSRCPSIHALLRHHIKRKDEVALEMVTDP